MDDLLELTAAEIAYLTAAWPETVATRVHDALAIREGGHETVQLAGLGSLLERGLVTESSSEPGYVPSAEARVAMLGLFSAEAMIEFTTVTGVHLHSLTIFVGPDLRLGVLAASAGRFALGVYPADVDWSTVLLDGIDDALRGGSDAIALLQLRSSAGVFERMAVRADGAGGWLMSESTAANASFRPTGRGEVAQRLAAALTRIDVGVPTIG